MRNRPAVLALSLALALVAISLVLFLTRPSPGPVATENHWRITRLENGEPAGAVIQPELPRDPSGLFPKPKSDATIAYQVEPVAVAALAAGWFPPSRFSADDLRMIEFLLLMPPAALLVCFFRNVIGMPSFGTFAPALLGLAFREVHSPLGIFVVLTIITAGWWLRKGLNELHLLQVPRTALLLSCVIVMLLVLLSATRGSGPGAITLFPLVILTGMIERFWTMEEEDGVNGSIGTLASTLFMAACVWLLASISVLSAWMLAHPETLGFIMAAQILIGRYTGFRLFELYRFRAFLQNGEAGL